MTIAFDTPPTASGRVIRSIVAGLCGSLAHTVLMTLKDWAGWLPTFRPYDGLQTLIASILGSNVPAVVPWLPTYFNGAVVLGILFGRIYRLLPGHSGMVKGALFGTVIWFVMGIGFFPAIGMGPFGTQTTLDLRPALFSLAMILIYSITLGVAYARLTSNVR